jgi:hypothetical protein
MYTACKELQSRSASLLNQLCHNRMLGVQLDVTAQFLHLACIAGSVMHKLVSLFCVHVVTALGHFVTAYELLAGPNANDMSVKCLLRTAMHLYA